jgi:hypothetical protein
MEVHEHFFSILSYSRIVYTLLKKGMASSSPPLGGSWVRVKKKQVTLEA